MLKELFPNDTRIQQDKEIIELIPSFNKLKEWSGKQQCSITFDSKIVSDGKGVLENKIMNKTNLYFISFNNQNNVFGGYMNELINKTRSSIKDLNAFVFLLIRNGKVNNKKYNIKKGEEQYAFYSYLYNDYLYDFGNFRYNGCDIVVYIIGYNSQYSCDSVSYKYNGEKQPLGDNTKQLHNEKNISFTNKLINFYFNFFTFEVSLNVCN